MRTPRHIAITPPIARYAGQGQPLSITFEAARNLHPPRYSMEASRSTTNQPNTSKLLDHPSSFDTQIITNTPVNPSAPVSQPPRSFSCFFSPSKSHFPGGRGRAYTQHHRSFSGARQQRPPPRTRIQLCAGHPVAGSKHNNDAQGKSASRTPLKRHVDGTIATNTPTSAILSPPSQPPPFPSFRNANHKLVR